MSGLTPITQAEDSGSDPEQEIPSMSPEDLRALIEGDAEAAALFVAANDRACAARCTAIAPKVIVDADVTERDAIRAYANPEDAATVLGKIKAVAEVNPFIAVLFAWMKPGAPGLNFGDPRVRASMTAPTETGGVGLTAQEAAPLLALAERSQIITEAEVEKLRTGT